MTDGSEPVAVATRLRRRWLAFLLNLVLAPSGYVYAGSVRAALAYIALALLAGVSFMTWTLVAPPGVYGLAPPPRMLIRLVEFSAAIGAVVGLHAAYIAGRPTRSRLRGWALWLTALMLWLVPAITAQAIRAVGPFAVYTVSSAAMEPTLKEGDVLALHGSRALCGLVSVRPGDVIIHKRPAKLGVRWVKRVVAGPGSTVEMRNGTLVIDGRTVGTVREGHVQVSITSIAGFPPQTAQVLRETLADGVSYRTFDLGPDGPMDTVAPLKLGPGQWYVLGDNRDNSLDSRAEGPIAQSDVCGVVSEILFSADHARVGRRP